MLLHNYYFAALAVVARCKAVVHIVAVPVVAVVRDLVAGPAAEVQT